MDKNEIKKFVIQSARLIDDKKGENIKVLDLKGLSSLCDYVIIATATSAPHLDALEQEVSMKLKENALYKTNRDGSQSNGWRVSDYGGFMLHLMTEETRLFYALDKVFSFAKELAWQKKEKPAAKTKVVKKTKTPKTAKKTTSKTAAKKSVKKTAKSVSKKTTKKISKKTTKKSVKKITKKGK